MRRHPVVIFPPAGIFVGLMITACNPPPPPMDTAALPTATTSAEPIYISTESPTPSAEDAPIAVLPTAPTLPKSVPLESERTANCQQKHCWRSWVVPKTGRTQVPPTTPNPDLTLPPPVAVWHEQLGPNVKLSFPRAKGLGLLGLVLEGVVTAAPSEGSTLAALKPWSTFAAPGVGLALTADPSGAAVLLVAYPLESDLDLPLAAVRRSERAVFWDQRPGSFHVEDLERTKPVAWREGAAHAWLGFDQSRSPSVYLGLLSLAPHLSDDGHLVEDVWEVLIPLEGRGTLSLSAASDDSTRAKLLPTEVPVQPGEVIMVPPGVQRTFSLSEEEPLLAVQIFVPPGPEQRYRQLVREDKGVGP